jgi:deoxycytidylate deaminase
MSSEFRPSTEVDSIMGSKRKSQKIDVFTDFVCQIASLSVSKTLKVGAIALKKDFSKIGSFGYNGSYPGAEINPATSGEENSLESGSSGFVHAEMNLVAKFNEHNPEDYVVLLTHSPCEVCMKILINSGFKCIYWKEEYRDIRHLAVLNSDKLKIRHGSFSDFHNHYPYILEEYNEKRR